VDILSQILYYKTQDVGKECLIPTESIYFGCIFTLNLYQMILLLPKIANKTLAKLIAGVLLWSESDFTAG
jgi:hypothetical protein